MLSGRPRAAQESHAVRDELSRFEGAWQLVYSETDGKTAPGDQIQDIRVVFKNQNYSVHVGDKQLVHERRLQDRPDRETEDDRRCHERRSR